MPRFAAFSANVHQSTGGIGILYHSLIYPGLHGRRDYYVLVPASGTALSRVVACTHSVVPGVDRTRGTAGGADLVVLAGWLAGRSEPAAQRGVVVAATKLLGSAWTVNASRCTSVSSGAPRPLTHRRCAGRSPLLLPSCPPRDVPPASSELCCPGAHGSVPPVSRACTANWKTMASTAPLLWSHRRR